MKKFIIKLLYGRDATELKPFEMAVINAVAKLVPQEYQERIAQQIPLNDHIQRLMKAKDVSLYQSTGIFGGGAAPIPQALALPGPETYCLGKARIKSSDGSISAGASIYVAHGKVFNIVFDREPKFGAEFEVSDARLIFDFTQLKTPIENLELPDSYRELVAAGRPLPNGWKLLLPDEVEEVAQDDNNLLVIARKGSFTSTGSWDHSALSIRFVVAYDGLRQQYVIVRSEDGESTPISTNLSAFFEMHTDES